jgi:hypothetical protein
LPLDAEVLPKDALAEIATNAPALMGRKPATEDKESSDGKCNISEVVGRARLRL